MNFYRECMDAAELPDSADLLRTIYAEYSGGAGKKSAKEFGAELRAAQAGFKQKREAANQEVEPGAIAKK
jgi:hypothetical protein